MWRKWRDKRREIIPSKCKKCETAFVGVPFAKKNYIFGYKFELS